MSPGVRKDYSVILDSVLSVLRCLVVHHAGDRQRNIQLVGAPSPLL
jgi:hypothetical protein